MLAQAHLHSLKFMVIFTKIILMLFVGTPMAIAATSDKKIILVHALLSINIDYVLYF